MSAVSADPLPWTHDFESLFDSQYEYICDSLRRLGVPTRDLEDVAHEVFMAVHARLSEYDSRRPVRPWLFAFAFHAAGNYRRLARHRREFMHDEAAEIEGGLHADHQLESAQTRELVVAALERVDLDRRAVFLLYDLEGCPMSEIVASLGIPLHTGYSRLRVAREEFRAAVERIQRKRGEK